METDRFDRIVRALAIAPSRRGVARLLAAGVLAVAGREEAAGRSERCQPACKVCQKCRKGKCKPNTNKNGEPCADGKVCANGRCVRAECQGDADCPEQTQSCQGGECQPICPAGACPDCNFCGVRFQADGDRTQACADSFTFIGDQACTTDADCPAGEPLCVRFPVNSCAEPPCGTCALSIETCEE